MKKTLAAAFGISLVGGSAWASKGAIEGSLVSLSNWLPVAEPSNTYAVLAGIAMIGFICIKLRGR